MSSDIGDHAPVTDQVLVQQVLDGDTGAFQTLVSRHRTAVFRTCLLILKHQDDAMDIVQETFFKAFQKLDSFRFQSRFDTWLKAIARNLALNRLRDHAKHRDSLAFDESHAPLHGGAKPTVIDNLERRELQAIVRQCIDQLPDKQGIPLKMHAVEGLSYEEISQELGIKLGTVNSRIYHARQKLEVLLKACLALRAGEAARKKEAP